MIAHGMMRDAWCVAQGARWEQVQDVKRCKMRKVARCEKVQDVKVQDAECYACVPHVCVLHVWDASVRLLLCVYMCVCIRARVYVLVRVCAWRACSQGSTAHKHPYL